MKDFKSSFPALYNYTYLNTASCGLLSSDLLAWRREQDQLLMEGASTYRDLHKQQFREIRKVLGGVFGTSDSQVALVPNFSFGFNVLLDGLPKETKILLLQGDYPSVNWPVEHRKFDVCYVEINADLEKNIEMAAARYNPDVFAFSSVQYISGIKLDLKFLQKLKDSYPKMLLLADATQFLGTTDFNFENSPLDAMGASGYKWMLGGFGNGTFLFKQNLRERISPYMLGYNSADTGRPNDGYYLLGHLEPGHQDVLTYGSLAYSMSQLKEIGMGKIESHLNHLTAEAKKSFSDLGLLQKDVLDREGHSQIFNLQANEEVFKRLKEHHILCSWRGNGIRVSFHFYNTGEDLQRLLSFL